MLDDLDDSYHHHQAFPINDDHSFSFKYSTPTMGPPQLTDIEPPYTLHEQ